MGVKQTIVEEAEMVQTSLMNNHKKTPKANLDWVPAERRQRLFIAELINIDLEEIWIQQECYLSK